MSTQLGLDLDPPKPAGALSAFHVRSTVPLAEAIEGAKRARAQDARVLAVFERFPSFTFTPSEVRELLSEGLAGFPLLTSVRRSMTNLTARKKLLHYPKDRRLGPAGSTEGTWGLA